MMVDDAVHEPTTGRVPRVGIAVFVTVLGLVLALTVHFAIRALDEARRPVPGRPSVESPETSDPPSGGSLRPG